MKLLEHQVASAFPQPALGAQVVERVNKLVATALDQPHAISGSEGGNGVVGLLGAHAIEDHLHVVVEGRDAGRCVRRELLSEVVGEEQTTLTRRAEHFCIVGSLITERRLPPGLRADGVRPQQPIPLALGADDSAQPLGQQTPASFGGVVRQIARNLGLHHYL